MTVGDLAPDFELADHNGTKVKLSSFRGKRVLLSFFRFAASPICVYNVDRLKQHSDMFKKAGVVTLCIFKSTPQNIVNYSPASSSEDAIALSDTNGSVFKTFMVKKSTRATMNGTVDLLKSFRKCKHVINVSADTSQIRQLPADFMINEDGVIVDLYRAERMGDHMTFERVEAFIPEEKRCRCSKRDCIVSIILHTALRLWKREYVSCRPHLFFVSSSIMAHTGSTV